MHIWLLTNFFEPDAGAAAVRLTRLAKLLHQRGHRVTVLTAMPHYPQGRIAPAYRGKFTTVEDRDGVRVARAWLWATPSPRISRKLLSQLSFMLTAALRGLALPRPDVIFVEGQPVFTGLAGWFLSRVKRAPYVLHIPAMWPEHLLTVGAMKETHPVYRTARALVNHLYRQAAAIVTLSPDWVEMIKGYIGERERVVFIDNGVDLDLFRPGLDASAFRMRHGLGNARVVSFIGTFATQYDFNVMFDVAAHFADRDDVLFVFIGGGSQNEMVEARLAKGDLPNLRWLGLIERAEILGAWAASHITYLSFRDQDLYRGTIPGKFFEAMACGVPIAAGLEGVGGDVIRESGAGVAVNFADAPALIDAVRRLLDDAEFHRQCSEAGRRYAEAKYNPDHVAAAHEQMLLAVARRR